MPVLSNSSAARRVLQSAAITTVTLASALFPAAAQQVAFTPQQCLEALKLGNGTLFKYNISPTLKASYDRFADSRCAPETLKFQVDQDARYQDSKAIGEYRVLLIALRTRTSQLEPAQ